MKRFYIGLSLFFFSCGSAAIDLKVQIASNQTENPILAIEKGRGTSNSGIFFQMEELHCPPTAIDDTSGAAPIVYPKNSQSSGGFSATQGSYSIPPSAMKSNKYYKISMIAYDVTVNTPLYRGVADCPISISDGNAQTGTICFGTTLFPPLCAGLTPTSQCAALIQPHCQ